MTSSSVISFSPSGFAVAQVRATSSGAAQQLLHVIEHRALDIRGRHARDRAAVVAIRDRLTGHVVTVRSGCDRRVWLGDIGRPQWAWQACPLIDTERASSSVPALPATGLLGDRFNGFRRPFWIKGRDKAPATARRALEAEASA